MCAVKDDLVFKRLRSQLNLLYIYIFRLSTLESVFYICLICSKCGNICFGVYFFSFVFVSILVFFFCFGLLAVNYLHRLNLAFVSVFCHVKHLSVNSNRDTSAYAIVAHVLLIHNI